MDKGHTGAATAAAEKAQHFTPSPLPPLAYSLRCTSAVRPGPTAVDVRRAASPPAEASRGLPALQAGIDDPVVYLSVYLLTYPILQWSIGKWLMTPDEPELLSAVATTQYPSVGALSDIASPAARTQPRLSAAVYEQLLDADASQPTSLSLLSLRDSARAAQAAAAFLQKHVLLPPVVGILLGLACTWDPVYYSLCGGAFGERLPKHTRCPSEGAPLGFFFCGIETLGSAAVPLNLIMLGSSLARGPDWTALPVRCNVGIVAAKLVLMPAFSTLLMLGLNLTVGRHGAGWFALRSPYDQIFHLAAVAVTATPTANNVVIMCSLYGSDRDTAAMATAIFSQYLLAPLLLPCTLTLAILTFHALDPLR
mmetsp:Transcript_26376/g.76985  ORF Transcript_26376/g.76985 Transcript_26376/m.76985 type:complete len:366 (-) Transcript_26376:157-1254(-)